MARRGRRAVLAAVAAATVALGGLAATTAWGDDGSHDDYDDVYTGVVDDAGDETPSLDDLKHAHVEPDEMPTVSDLPG
ncbi:hypothetical protein [Actinomadura parmotrematis]|uniref:Uncharacterized protein n=1 Tax=Actinomadura parmotrematis TaxID=2864039 RepID=A0ABS7FYM8_9ACTN|nr:hypothetical protein [Actinomadura parmotrematis]MBW8485542.1 hypothetical protein [Actinomadura parmotrematis]